MSFFCAPHGWGEEEWAKCPPPPPKICDRHPALMEHSTVIPYLKEIQKIYKSRYTTLEFCWDRYFFTGNRQLRNPDIECILKHNLQFFLTFIKLLKVVLLIMLTISTILPKLGTLGFLKIKIFWNKCYNVKISVHDIGKIM